MLVPLAALAVLAWRSATTASRIARSDSPPLPPLAFEVYAVVTRCYVVGEVLVWALPPQ